MTVWVVIQHDPYDGLAWVEGVFSSREYAEGYLDKVFPYDGWNANPRTRPRWSVNVSIKEAEIDRPSSDTF